MKKVFLTTILMLFVVTMTNAQFTKIGGGLGFTSGYDFHQMPWDYNKSGNLNVSFKGIYELSLPVHLSPSFTIFLPHVWKNSGGEKTTVSTMMFDLNGHYVFNSLDKFEFYGLAGLDIMLAWKKAVSGTYTQKESDNALGLNLGVGAYMKLTEQFDLYGEAKYLYNNKYNQIMVNAGVLINIDWLKKNENNNN
jgi:hypothetical protein